VLESRRGERGCRMSHTPGPWKIGRSSPEWCVVADSDEGTHGDGPSRHYYGGAMVCEGIKSDANAYLIAAAPLMYAYVRKQADNGDAEAIVLIRKIND